MATEDEPLVEAIGLVVYDLITDELTSTECPTYGPAMTVNVPNLIESIGLVQVE